jgi:hypothetical protein
LPGEALAKFLSDKLLHAELGDVTKVHIAKTREKVASQNHAGATSNYSETPKTLNHQRSRQLERIDGLDDSRFTVEALCSEPLSLLVNSRHPLSVPSAIVLEDLRDQPFLLTDPDCAHRSKLERALMNANIRPKAVMEFTSVETIKQCAALGMGIACLPTIVAQS